MFKVTSRAKSIVLVLRFDLHSFNGYVIFNMEMLTGNGKEWGNPLFPIGKKFLEHFVRPKPQLLWTVHTPCYYSRDFHQFRSRKHEEENNE